MEESGQESKIPSWIRFVSIWAGLMVLTYLFSVSIIAMMEVGLGLFKAIQAYGFAKAISIYVLGVSGGGLFLVMMNLVLLIVKRITKWKWLQIPVE